MHTKLIAVLNRSMVVSVALLGGAWLWQERLWGCVLAVPCTVKGAVNMLVLPVATFATVVAGHSEDWTQQLL